MKQIAKVFLVLVTSLVPCLTQAGTITVVGNGSGGGPIFVTSASTSISIGTRIRIGNFTDATALSTTISNFLAGSADYTTTFNALNSNFVDVGTNVTNFGASSQAAVGGASFTPSATQFGFNGITSLAINGAAAANYNTFNGTITGVNYSLSLGTGKNLYLWTAFNNELAIVRNADGTGTSSWITPASDLSGVTMNLSGLQITAGGAMQTSEVLLGTVVDYASGSDLIKLQAAIPEPSVMSLSLLGFCVLFSRKRKENKVSWRS
ncbi:MAG: hypothetical protein EBS53_09745 [Bacteroidetes bacterium]|nr:hypothetical protein [Bacteroidota bacterium]